MCAVCVWAYVIEKKGLEKRVTGGPKCLLTRRCWILHQRLTSLTIIPCNKNHSVHMPSIHNMLCGCLPIDTPV